MLLPLVSIQRKQTHLQLNIDSEYMKESSDESIFILSKHVKQSRPNYLVPPFIIPRYPVDPDAYPYLCLEEYLTRTSTLRQDNVLLFSYIKPHNKITSATLAR